jgi:hypothetical protein
MKRWWKVLLAGAVIVVLIVVAVAVATSGALASGATLHHGSTIKVSGTFSTIAGLDDPNPKIDGDTIVMSTLGYNQVHGSFEGVNRVEGTMTLDAQTGAFTFQSVEWFTGTLNGVAGTTIMISSGTGQFTDATGLNYSLQGTSTFVGAAGGLAVIKSGGISYSETVTGGVETPVAYTGTCKIK